MLMQISSSSINVSLNRKAKENVQVWGDIIPNTDGTVGCSKLLTVLLIEDAPKWTRTEVL